MSSKNKETGALGERIACSYLRRHSYRILEKNFKTRKGELDIIAYSDRTLIFVEVKCRHSERFGKPFESVTPAKEKKIREVAQQYLSMNKNGLTKHKDLRCRFDVISILFDDEFGECEMLHLEDAF